MINYFRKILTGYTTVKKNVNGKEFRYLYSGKPVFFDPLLMLREFGHRVADESVQRLKLNATSQELISNLPKTQENALPSVICIGTLNGKELKVSRFTQKDGIHPLSIYLFEMDGVLFGSFRRIYDYGTRLSDFGNKFAALNQSELDLSKEKWLWKGEQGEQLFLEKFGHSQVWHFTDLNQIPNWKNS
jgi:hypothetical protein